MKLTIELTPAHYRALMQALDITFRAGMGQFGEVADMFDHTNADTRQEVESAVKSIVFPELQGRGYYSISSDHVPEAAKLMHDLHNAIRHRVSWERAGNPPARDWSSMMTVDYDEPMGYSGEPLPTVAVDLQKGAT